MRNQMIISTGDLDRPYEIIDTIFALDKDKQGFLSGADPGKAFDNVKSQLRKLCAKIGGNAVINCQFEYRIALDGHKQVVEIFAYGTAVKLEPLKNF